MKTAKCRLMVLLAIVVLTGCVSLRNAPAQSGETGLQAVKLAEATGLRAPAFTSWRAAEIGEIAWDDAQDIDQSERQALCATLRDALQENLSSHASHAGPTLRIQARIIEAAPVSPALNTLAAILIFVPVERGGAAVLIEAYDNERKVASLSLARPAAWTDLRGYFSRYAHAKTVLKNAAAMFAQLLEDKNANADQPA